MNAKCRLLLCLSLSLSVPAVPVHAEQVTIEIRSVVPENGLLFAPVWVGFHDGTFDLFDAGKPIASGSALEQLVENADPEPLQARFAETVPGSVGGFVTAPEGFPDVPLFEPGEMGLASFELDPTQNRYLSFAAMILPSNDAFVANDDPQAIELFDAAGRFKGKQTVLIFGSEVWDAGTELNAERDAAFLGQDGPDAGVSTADPVRLHPGFIGSYANPAVGEDPIILGAYLDSEIFFDRVAADFTRPDAVIAQITIIPEPATAVFLTVGGLALLRRPRSPGSGQVH